MFQPLIGTIKTLKQELADEIESEMFQPLIGTIKTGRKNDVFNYSSFAVSTPYRDDKNDENTYAIIPDEIMFQPLIGTIKTGCLS